MLVYQVNMYELLITCKLAWNDLSPLSLAGLSKMSFIANDMAITFQSDWEEVDDIEALSFKSIIGLREYLVVFF